MMDLAQALKLADRNCCKFNHWKIAGQRELISLLLGTHRHTIYQQRNRMLLSWFNRIWVARCRLGLVIIQKNL
jgi:hypothetical protein